MDKFDPRYKKSNFPQIRPDWLALTQEEVLLPEQRIVDTHHHFWDEESAPYHAGDLLADLRGGHAVEATVLVECKARYRADGPVHLRPVGETEFAVAQAEHAARQGVNVCQGIVGWADLQLGERVEEVLAAHAEAGKGRFRGVRCRAAWSDDPVLAGPADGPPAGLVLEADFQAGVRTLTRMGYSLDLWLYHTQLGDAIRLAQDCAETPVVLNHVGGPLGIGPFAGRRAEVFDVWRRDMLALARCANVHVKLGGLAMPRTGFPFASAAAPVSSEELAAAWRPYIETCIEAFGAERCMFESNFPVDKGMCGYTVLWNAFKRVVGGASVGEREALFDGTARVFYRI
ncbi:amidohydrolase family protein [Xylophilus sp. GOD-11R]|uniref:amidohydrolase family protein n=1 Tax=Xylophilus sp. GOD-11R TaxID=3089814 RepID=UPI00298CEA4A|nr:amidohydrolase family protein [Xylophilus sp. GOD-11R]WPB55444.1 amidohydrolase family protein [Xylophilus sp. GOD-11R]